MSIPRSYATFLKGYPLLLGTILKILLNLRLKLFILIVDMEIKFNNDDFSMFKSDARKTLFKHITSYTVNLKREAERLAYNKYESREDAKVSKQTIDSIIGTHGYYHLRKPHIFYTYILPVLDALNGALLAAMILQSDKKWWHGLLMGIFILLIVVSIAIRYRHDNKN